MQNLFCQPYFYSSSFTKHKIAIMTRLFLDTEFTGLIQNTTLVSLALYNNENCYFYAEFTDFNSNQITPWLIEHVIDKLHFQNYSDYYNENDNIINIKGVTTIILEHLKCWLSKFDIIEIWGDVPVYDWMLFCELFGGALNLPKNVHYIPFDIATLAKIIFKKSDFSRIEFVEELLPSINNSFQHNSLFDAMVQKLCYDKFTLNETRDD